MMYGASARVCERGRLLRSEGGDEHPLRVPSSAGDLGTLGESLGGFSLALVSI